MRHPDENPFPLIGTVGLGIVCSFSSAVLFVWSLWHSLPPTDGAYGSPFLMMLLDPFVLTVMVPTAFVAGLLMGPIVHFTIAGRHFRRSMFILVGSLSIWIATVTPISAWKMLFGLLPVLACSLAACRFLQFTQLSSNPQTISAA